jgi:hypothetical protein
MTLLTQDEQQNPQSGQALVMLLVFMTMALTLTVAATVVTIVSSQATSKYTLGQEALRIAEAAGENATMRLLRNPNYTGETLSLGSGSATITTSGISPKTITIEGVVSSMHRKIQATATFTGGVVSFSNWSEVQ